VARHGVVGDLSLPLLLLLLPPLLLLLLLLLSRRAFSRTKTEWATVLLLLL